MKILYLLALVGVVCSQGYGGNYWGVPTYIGKWQGIGHPIPVAHAYVVKQVPYHKAPIVHAAKIHSGYSYPHYASYHKYEGAPIGHDGRVVDTPEVAHAKAEHFKAHEAAKHGHIGYGLPGGFVGLGYRYGKAEGLKEYAGAIHKPVPHHYPIVYSKWHGPPAHIELTHDGKFLKDTPEVAHAKAQHFAAVAHEKSKHIGEPYHLHHGHHDDGEYKHEGELEGQYKGEGLIEGQYHGEGLKAYASRR